MRILIALAVQQTEPRIGIREYLENQKEVTAAPGHEVAGSFTDRRQISWVFQFRWHIVGGSQAYP